jgi:hypothetical protein
MKSEFQRPLILKISVFFILLTCAFSVSASFPFVFGGVNDEDPTLGVDIDSNSDNPQSMAVGGNGLLYIGGDFLGEDINFSANFSRNASLVTSALNSAGNEFTDDGFISAYKANTQLQWVVALQGNGSDSVVALTADDSGNVYATGSFRSSSAGAMKLNRISAKGVVTLLGDFSTADDWYKAYIMKLSPTGTLIWFMVLDGDETDSYSEGQAIAIDNNDNVYVAGDFADEIDFDPSGNNTDISSNDGERSENGDAFILKLSENGSLIWVKTLGSENDGDIIDQILVDSVNNALYIGGTFSSDSDGVNTDGDGILDFDSEDPAGATDDSGTHSGDNFGFVQKLQTTNGNLIWSKAFLADNEDGSVSAVSSIALNSDDSSLFIAGSFDGNIDFNPDLTTTNIGSSIDGLGDEDLFFVKLDAAGNYVWHGVIGNQAKNTDEGIDDIHFGNDLLYISGDYSGVTLVGSGSAADIAVWTDNIPASNGDQDALLLQLNASDGSFVWARNFGGSDYDTGDSFAQDSANNIYFSGQFKNTIDLDPTIKVINATTKDGVGSGGRDAFVIKLSESGGLITQNSNPPIAKATVLTSYVQQNQWGKVDGSGSYDINGNTITFAWRQLAGPRLIILKDNEELTFMTPFVTEITPIIIELIVSNGTLESSPILVTFDIGPDTAAEFDVVEIVETSDGGSFSFFSVFLLTLIALRRKFTKSKTI